MKNLNKRRRDLKSFNKQIYIPVIYLNLIIMYNLSVQIFFHNLRDYLFNTQVCYLCFVVMISHKECDNKVKSHVIMV